MGNPPPAGGVVSVRGARTDRCLGGADLGRDRRDIAALGHLLARGTLTPPARRLMPLEEAAAAHALLERRGVEGRLLLVPNPNA